MAAVTTNTLVQVDHTGTPTTDPNLATIGEIAVALNIDSAAVSTATSKAVSTVNAAAPDSSSISSANSRATSSGSQASVADSKSISGSVNTSVTDSKTGSVSQNTSIADSKAVSVGAATILPTVSGVPGFQQSGTGAVLRVANTKLAETAFSITDFGADATGSTDATAAIQAAITARKALGAGTLVIPPGTFKITQNTTLVFDLPDGSTIAWHGTFSFTSLTAKTAVQIGPTSSNANWYKMIGGIDVRRTTIDSAGTSVGVDLRNLSFCKIDVRTVTGFAVGLRLNGTQGNGGLSLNEIHIGWVVDNGTNLQLSASGAGYCNQNVLIGGELLHSSAFAAGVSTTNLIVDYYATNPINGNLFINTSMEDGNATNRKAAFIDGQNNLFIGLRAENLAISATYTIEFGTHSTKNVLIAPNILETQILDNGAAGSDNTWQSSLGPIFKSSQADLSTRAMFLAQALFDGLVRCFGTRDPSGADTFWVNGSGTLWSNSALYATIGHTWNTNDGTYLDRGLFHNAGSPVGVPALASKLNGSLCSDDTNGDLYVMKATVWKKCQLI